MIKKAAKMELVELFWGKGAKYNYLGVSAAPVAMCLE